MLLRSVCRYSCTPLTLKISARRGASKKLAGNRFIKGEAPHVQDADNAP